MEKTEKWLMGEEYELLGTSELDISTEPFQKLSGTLGSLRTP